MPLGPRELLFVAVLPGAAALVIMAVAWRVWKRDSVARGHWGGPLAVVAAFAIAFRFVAGGWPGFPPRESMSWLFTIALAAAVVGLIDSVLRMPVWLRAVIVFAFAGTATGLLLQTVMQEWATAHRAGAIAVFAFAGALWWATLEWSAAERDGRLVTPLVLFLISATLAMALMLPPDASLRFGQLAISLSAAAGASVVLAWFRDRVDLRRGATTVFAVMLVTLIAAAHFLFDWRLIYAIPLLASPGYIALGRVIPAATMGRRNRLLVRLAPVALAMAVVLAVAVIEFRKSAAQDAYSDPYGWVPKGRSTPADGGAI